jgi:putative FmdB family regulatory protein
MIMVGIWSDVMIIGRMKVKYDFQCQNCGTIFEINASPTTVSNMRVGCPNCCSDNTKKIITATNFIFKTNGFYSKDIQENRE